MAVANEAPCCWLGYGVWSTPRTCNFPIPISRQWQPAKPRTGMSIISCFEGFWVFLFYCTVVAICISFQCIASSNGFGDGTVTFRIFSDLFTDPFLSGVTGVLFPHQNSQRLFRASVCARHVCSLQLALATRGRAPAADPQNLSRCFCSHVFGGPGAGKKMLKLHDAFGNWF